MSRRIERVNEVIKEVVSRIILREVEFSPGVLVTLTRVETAQDLRDSNIFISVLPEKDLDKTVGFLNKRAGALQKKLNEKLRMKPLPRIKFLAEKETAKAARIEAILEELKRK